MCGVYRLKCGTSMIHKPILKTFSEVIPSTTSTSATTVPVAVPVVVSSSSATTTAATTVPTTVTVTGTANTTLPININPPTQVITNNPIPDPNSNQLYMAD